MNYETLEIGEEEFKKLKEYSEKPEVLKDLIPQIKIEISEPTFKKYFSDDKEERNVYTIKITREGQTISFKYGDSVQNTEQGLKPEPYSLLCCCASDYHIPDNFKDFCSEFGYDEDSKKAENTFNNCLEQSEKIQKIFTEEEAEALPR